MNNSNFNEIKQLASQLQNLAKRANVEFTVEVDNIVNEQIKNQKVIENLLDRMLDFAQFDDVLLLYKKLCRYYLPLNPKATADYIYAYRDMWDNNEKEIEGDDE